MHGWIFIKEYGKENSNESLLSIRLPHPRTGQAVRYILQDQTLLEIRKLDCESQRSWFIGSTVQSDGSLFCLTPIDPLFVLIPILDTCRRKTSDSNGLFIPLEDILDGEQYPSLPKLSVLNNIEKYVGWVCDCQVMNSGKVVFRLNDEKVMAWLKLKISHILSNFDSFNSLKQLIQHMNNDSIDDRLQKEIRLKATIEIVMEYLPLLWRERLMAVYNFDALGRLEVSNTQIADNPADYYARKTMRKEVLPPKGPPTKKQKLSTGQAVLAKANIKGMKKLTTFFAKK
ncbi:7756_t:CDS:10 [Paraglomus brasilianum]|uniref:Ribonuclease H2 subunit B n=1 Tax=Paraglomus brasilianum TaxID=144538 RepID=A0A9N8VUY8_9GLOM|nr:7756_t:CDS:10 [Paraglomus brasilianum]